MGYANYERGALSFIEDARLTLGEVHAVLDRAPRIDETMQQYLDRIAMARDDVERLLLRILQDGVMAPSRVRERAPELPLGRPVQRVVKKPPVEDLPLHLSVAQVAERTGFSKHSVYNAIHRRDVAHVRSGNKYMVPSEAFLKWTKRLRREANTSLKKE